MEESQVLTWVQDGMMQQDVARKKKGRDKKGAAEALTKAGIMWNTR